MATVVEATKNIKFDKFYHRAWRAKNPLKVFKANRKFRNKNKVRLKKYHKKWYQEHKVEHDKKSRKYLKKNPWICHYSNARQRCLNPKQADFNSYKGKGIKFKMSVNDFKFLWFRDGASKMKKPSIDRIDVNGDYFIDNCEFVEMSINLKRRNK